MATRLAVLVVLEVCLCAFFGWQLAHAAEPVNTTPLPELPAAPAAAPATPVSAPLANANDVVRPARDVAPLRTAAPAKWNADDPLGVMLTGTVRWSDGTAVADPRVYARQDRTGRGATTSSDGTFVLVGLSPGEWKMTVTTDGAESTETITLGDDAEQQRDFVLDRTFPIRVLAVTPDGKDLQKAGWEAKVAIQQWHVAGQRDPLPERLAPTDYGIAYAGDAKWSGERNSQDGFLGTLHLKNAPPAHAALLLRHVVVQQQRIEPGQSEVKFVVNVAALQALAATVSVRVLDDATNAPVSGLFVGLETSSGMTAGGPKTGDDGRITLTTHQPGLLFLNIRDKSRETYWSTIRVEPGDKLDLGDIRLGAQTALMGRLLTAEGKPGTGNLNWTELKWRTKPTAFSRNRTTRVEADGSFEVHGTGFGPIALQVFGPDGTIAMGVFDNPSPTPIEMRLEPGATYKVVRSTNPTKAYTTTFFDAQSRPLYATTIGTQAYDRERRMLAGTWKFEVHDEADRLVQSGTLTLDAATPATLEIR